MYEGTFWQAGVPNSNDTENPGPLMAPLPLPPSTVLDFPEDLDSDAGCPFIKAEPTQLQ